ncbi:MAG: hypothetical protein ACE5H7_11465 [Acidiferrobacterales bacterium]
MRTTLIIFILTALLVINIASAGWTAKRVLDPVKDETRCMLESTTKTINDGYQETAIVLRVDDKALQVATQSNIDPSKDDISMQVDKKQPIKMDKVYLEQNVIFEREIATIIKQFKEGLRARFTLRFWPTYPDTGQKTVTFSLIGFTKAYGGLPDC